jgi:multiple antibiotic resistance protein
MLGIANRLSVKERLRMSQQICLIGGILIFTFAFFGKIILDDIFHISTEAFQVGGGLYLFTIGLGMVFSKDFDEQQNEGTAPQDPFSFVITPLATPLLVGPGTITAVLVRRTALPNSISCVLTFYGALAVAMLLVYFLFFISCKFSKYLTPSLLKVIEKLMGILIACLAINSILQGLKTFFQHL